MTNADRLASSGHVDDAVALQGIYESKESVSREEELDTAKVKKFLEKSQEDVIVETRKLDKSGMK